MVSAKKTTSTTKSVAKKASTKTVAKKTATKTVAKKVSVKSVSKPMRSKTDVVLDLLNQQDFAPTIQTESKRLDSEEFVFTHDFDDTLTYANTVRIGTKKQWDESKTLTEDVGTLHEELFDYLGDDFIYKSGIFYVDGDKKLVHKYLTKNLGMTLVSLEKPASNVFSSPDALKAVEDVGGNGQSFFGASTTPSWQSAVDDDEDEDEVDESFINTSEILSPQDCYFAVTCTPRFQMMVVIADKATWDSSQKIKNGISFKFLPTYFSHIKIGQQQVDVLFSSSSSYDETVKDMIELGYTQLQDIDPIKSDTKYLTDPKNQDLRKSLKDTLDYQDSLYDFASSRGCDTPLSDKKKKSLSDLFTFYRDSWNDEGIPQEKQDEMVREMFLQRFGVDYVELAEVAVKEIPSQISNIVENIHGIAPFGDYSKFTYDSFEIRKFIETECIKKESWIIEAVDFAQSRTDLLELKLKSRWVEGLVTYVLFDKFGDVHHFYTQFEQ